MKGGKRSGSGRPKGALGKRTQEAYAKATKGGKLMPLDYLLSVMRDESNSTDTRIEAAKAAATYLHPKIQAIEHSGGIELSKYEDHLRDLERPDDGAD